MPKDVSKILILGLSNSGKTSIVLSLQKNINLLSYTSLEPTKKFDITEFEDMRSKFHIWDFGGQDQYRDDHLKNLNSYLTGTRKVIYVIDIQDIKKYDMSLQYFENILKILKKEDSSIKLSIFLHKFDPDLQIKENIVSDLINEIVEKIPSPLDFKIHKTTVYTVFRKITII